MTTTHSAELNGGVWTSWLPVTTAWTSQSACNSAAWARFGIQDSGDSGGYWPYIYDPAYAQSVANSLTCLPPQATQWWDSGITVSNTITSYSLGPLVCPAAYTTFSTSVVSASSTSIICCPTNFDFVRGLLNNAGIDGVCTSPLTSGQVLSYASPTGDSYVSVGTTISTSIPLIAVPVEGYNFAASTTSSTPSTITTSSTTTTSTTSSSSTNSGTPTNLSLVKSGLTGGAKAGIGVGVGVFALILIAALAAFMLRRRKRNAQVAPAPVVSELPGNGEHKTPQEVEGSLGYAGRVKGPHEVEGSSGYAGRVKGPHEVEGSSGYAGRVKAPHEVGDSLRYA